MQRAPLQTYASALVFSPYESQIRKENLAHYPTWFKYGPAVEDHWGPVLQTLQGHWSLQDQCTGVAALAFSFDGRYLASLSTYGELLLWDAMTGTLHSTLTEVHNSDVHSKPALFSRLVFSCNGQLASLSSASEVRVWEPVIGVTCRRITEHIHRDVSAIAFAYDGTLAVSYDACYPHTWIYRAGALPDLVETKTVAVGLSFLSEGTLALMCSLWYHLEFRGGEIVLHNPKTRAERRIPITGATAASFSSNDQLALSVKTGYKDHSLRLYYLRNESYQVLDRGIHEITALAFSSNNRRLFVGSDDRSVQLWDLESGIRSVIWSNPVKDRIHWIAPAPDGRLAITSRYNTKIRILDLQSDSRPYNGDLPKGSKQPRLRLSSNGRIQFSPDGKQLVYESDEGTHVLDSATQRELCLLQSYEVRMSITISGEYVASGLVYGAVLVWSSASGKLLRTLKGNSGCVAAVAFSPNNKILLAADIYQKRTKLDVWDTKTWSLQHTLELLGGHSTGSLDSMAFSQNGKRIALLYSGSLSIWDAEQYVCLQNIGIKFSQEEIWENQISSFAEDSYIDTTLGRVYFDQPPDDNGLWKVEDARWRVEDDWLYRDGKRLLWLPPDFRPSCLARYDDLFVMGHSSGKVTFFEGNDNDSAPESAYQIPAPESGSTSSSKAREYYKRSHEADPRSHDSRKRIK